jgi:hypothetical protein
MGALPDVLHGYVRLGDTYPGDVMHHSIPAFAEWPEVRGRPGPA